VGKTIKLANDTYLVNDLYSTTEKRVGTWIDGKPIYRIVYDLTMTPNSSGYFIYTGDSARIKKIKDIIRYDYFFEDGYIWGQAMFNGMSFRPLYIQREYGGIGFYCSTGNINTFNGKRAIIILEYTKTTD